MTEKCGREDGRPSSATAICKALCITHNHLAFPDGMTRSRVCHFRVRCARHHFRYLAVIETIVLVVYNNGSIELFANTAVVREKVDMFPRWLSVASKTITIYS